ncbi:hypothetical protein Gasu2_50800 [Galdieria sulphuraria]|uniref:BAR protein n=1 Tax=Galdieria sulphuraria TaxID=130081 RepID=M2XLG3_GALSU|nr:BAR protein [Galdieria sulphuraria]EME31012.1 BAR protein [Galdieria sulphuraria]GJD10916.1 hypothetical protein Gasu2_50800 [Galdieria sulphuraria]|eukprot:XP_005707532.1 BAR protein [Galdieria sulphuraria]
MGLIFSKPPPTNSEVDTIAARLFAIDKCIHAIVPKLESATDKWKTLLSVSRSLSSELNEVYEKHAAEYKTVDSSFRSLDAFQSFMQQFHKDNTVTNHCIQILKSYSQEISNLKNSLKNRTRHQEKYESLKKKYENIRNETPKKKRLEERMREAEEVYQKSSNALLQKMNELYLKHAQVLEHALIGLWHSDLKHAEAFTDNAYAMRKAVDAFLDKVANNEMDKINSTWLKEKTTAYPSNGTKSRVSVAKKVQKNCETAWKALEKPSIEGSTISTLESNNEEQETSQEETSMYVTRNSSQTIPVA